MINDTCNDIMNKQIYNFTFDEVTAILLFSLIGFSIGIVITLYFISKFKGYKK